MDIPNVIRIAPGALQGVLVGFVAGPSDGSVLPGEPLSFMWSVNRSATSGWTNASLTLTLIEDSGVQRELWTTTHRFPLPPPSGLHPPPGAWPPWGAIAEQPVLDSEGRTAVYSGFGQRQFRLTLTPDAQPGGPFTADFFRQISPEPHVAEWATLSVPAIGDWNAAYAMSVTVSSDAWASLSAQFEVVETDQTAASTTDYAGSFVRIPAAGGVVGGATIAPWVQSVAPHNWRWVYKPMYHADDALRQHPFTYALSLTWSDEFQNPYPVVELPPTGMVVRVSDAKWAAAAVAEMWFWVIVAITAALAIAAATFGIGAAAASAAAAGLTGAAAAAATAAATAYGVIAAAAGLLGGVAALLGPWAIGAWQELADDPPAPDFAVLNIDDELPTEVQEEMSAFADLARATPDLNDDVADSAAELIRFAALAGAASRTYSKVLGAQYLGASSIGTAQTANMTKIHNDLVESASRIKGLPAGLFVNPPSDADLVKKLSDAQALLTTADKLDPKAREAALSMLETAKSDAKRGAALLADKDYLDTSVRSAITLTLIEIQSWVASSV